MSDRIREKLQILADAANMMCPVPLVVVTVK